MVIRSFQPADTDAVIELWAKSDLTRPWNDPRKDIGRKLQMQPECFLVGEVEGKVVASIMAGYDGHRGWLNYLAVDPEFRKNGYGRAIVEHAEQMLLALGCPKVNLQIRTTNADAMGFYECIGYSKDDVVSFGKRLVADG